MTNDEFSMDFFSLKGNAAIVIGGSSGFGLAFSTALAKAGANIFIPSFIPNTGPVNGLVNNAGICKLNSVLSFGTPCSRP